MSTEVKKSHINLAVGSDRRACELRIRAVTYLRSPAKSHAPVDRSCYDNRGLLTRRSLVRELGPGKIDVLLARVPRRRPRCEQRLIVEKPRSLIFRIVRHDCGLIAVTAIRAPCDNQVAVPSRVAAGSGVDPVTNVNSPCAVKCNIGIKPEIGRDTVDGGIESPPCPGNTAVGGEPGVDIHAAAFNRVAGDHGIVEVGRVNRDAHAGVIKTLIAYVDGCITRRAF